MTNFKMTVRADCAVSTRSLLHPSVKALAHWLSWTGGETGSGQVSTIHPPWVAGIQNKASFPFYQSSLCTGFWVASSWTPLSITTLYTYSPPPPLSQIHDSGQSDWKSGCSLVSVEARGRVPTGKPQPQKRVSKGGQGDHGVSPTRDDAGSLRAEKQKDAHFECLF